MALRYNNPKQSILMIWRIVVSAFPEQTARFTIGLLKSEFYFGQLFCKFPLSYKKDFAPFNLKWTFWRYSRESWLPFVEQTIIVYMPLKMTDPVTIIAQSTQCRASRPILAHSKTLKHWGDRIMTWWSPMAFHRRVIVSVAFVG